VQAKVTSQRKGGVNSISNMKPQMVRNITNITNFSKTETFGAETNSQPWALIFQLEDELGKWKSNLRENGGRGKCHTNMLFSFILYSWICQQKPSIFFINEVEEILL
jgi:hypothetical protein